MLVWDATCPDTFVPSYLNRATMAAGEVAAMAEEKKCSKYSTLPTSLLCASSHETSGAIGPKSVLVLKDLGKRLRRESGDSHGAAY